jgi:hypothetical protein
MLENETIRHPIATLLRLQPRLRAAKFIQWQLVLVKLLNGCHGDMDSSPGGIVVPKVTARLCPHHPSVLSPWIERAPSDLARIERRGFYTREIVIALELEAADRAIIVLSEDLHCKEQDSCGDKRCHLVLEAVKSQGR